MEFFNCCFRHTVTFSEAARDIVRHVSAFFLQIQVKAAYRCHSVNVIVAVDNDFVSVFNAFDDSVRGIVHVEHHKGVVQLFFLFSEKGFCFCRGHASAVHEKLGCRQFDSEFVCYFFHYRAVPHFLLRRVNKPLILVLHQYSLLYIKKLFYSSAFFLISTILISFFLFFRVLSKTAIPAKQSTNPAAAPITPALSVPNIL